MNLPTRKNWLVWMKLKPNDFFQRQFWNIERHPPQGCHRWHHRSSWRQWGEDQDHCQDGHRELWVPGIPRLVGVVPWSTNLCPLRHHGMDFSQGQQSECDVCFSQQNIMAFCELYFCWKYLKRFFFCFILLTHEGSRRGRSTRNSHPVMTSSAGPVPTVVQTTGSVHPQPTLPANC